MLSWRGAAIAPPRASARLSAASTSASRPDPPTASAQTRRPAAMAVSGRVGVGEVVSDLGRRLSHPESHCWGGICRAGVTGSTLRLSALTLLPLDALKMNVAEPDHHFFSPLSFGQCQNLFIHRVWMKSLSESNCAHPACASPVAQGHK